MTYKIIGESIKSATSIAIGKIFNNPIRYKESVTKPKYPHFFISQPTLNIESIGRNRLQLDYLINVRYRIAADLAQITNIQQTLDEVGIKLCTELLTLDLEKPVKTKNRRYEKDDGVLQFFFNVTVYAEPEKEQITKLKNYKLNEEVL